MQLSITGIHFELTEALKNHVTEKFQILTKHFDKIGNVTVDLEAINPHTHLASCTINLAPNHTIHASAEKQDMYKAIDALSHTADRLVLKHKETIRDHHRG